jgi:hypothetical protein
MELIVEQNFMTFSPLRLDGVTYAIEKSIVFLCSRPIFDEEQAHTIRSLLQHPSDWNYIVAYANRHGVLYLIAHTLNGVAPDLVTGDYLNEIQQNCYSVNRQLSTQLSEITSLFVAHGIKVISYKGPTLSAILYNNRPLRVSRDLDLLVHPRDYKKSRALLVRYGYEVDSIGWYKSHFLHHAMRINLDIHRNVVPRRYRFVVNFSDLWNRCTTFKKFPEISVPIPCVEDLLLILCLDLVKDVAQPGELRLIKFVDIRELVCIRKDLNWGLFITRARCLRLSRVVSFALRATDRLYGIPLPPDVRREIYIQRRLSELIDQAITLVFEVDSSLPGRYFHELNTVLIMQDSFRSKVMVAIYFLILATKLVGGHWARKACRGAKGNRFGVLP